MGLNLRLKKLKGVRNCEPTVKFIHCRKHHKEFVDKVAHRRKTKHLKLIIHITHVHFEAESPFLPCLFFIPIIVA